jgi:AbrB family looped-hinge helix DNA binding protein
MTLETAKMSDRGQIIIPKEVREQIHATENTIFTVMPFNSDTIIMKKLDKDKLIKEFRSIRSKTKKLSPEEINEEIKHARKAK